MKAIITVIDDDGKVICKDQVLDPIKEEIVNLDPYHPPVKEAKFHFAISQLADFQSIKVKMDKEVYHAEI